MRLLLKLLGASSLGSIPLSPRRVQQYEAQNFRYLGIRPEPHYVWSREFRRAEAATGAGCEASGHDHRERVAPSGPFDQRVVG